MQNINIKDDINGHLLVWSNFVFALGNNNKFNVENNWIFLKGTVIGLNLTWICIFFTQARNFTHVSTLSQKIENDGFFYVIIIISIFIVCCEHVYVTEEDLSGALLLRFGVDNGLKSISRYTLQWNLHTTVKHISAIDMLNVLITNFFKLCNQYHKF